MVFVGDKLRISASVESDLKNRLDAKEELNVSKLIESLLREYLAHGESSTVALHLLRDDLRRKIDNKQIEKRMLENEIEALEQQVDEVSQKIKERRKAGLKGVDEIVQQVENGRMNPEYIDTANPLIKDKASEAGVPTGRFVKEVKARL